MAAQRPGKEELLNLAGEIVRDKEKASTSERLQAMKLLFMYEHGGKKGREEAQDDGFFTGLAEGIAARIIERIDRTSGGGQ